MGIPTVKDRVVQMAVYLVLMPIFEADFHPHSYGFRPKRNAHQALDAIVEALRSGRTEVLDADLSKYFDTMPHRQLLRAVARRVSDGSIWRLIKQWLRAPVVEEDIRVEPVGNHRLYPELEFGHSGDPPLRQRTLVLSGGSGLDHGLAGSRRVAGGKSHWVVG